MGKRGQISMEYIMLLGVLILALIPLFYYSYDKINYEIKINLANDAVSSLAKAADIVYSLGPGAKRYVEITIPRGVINSYINGTEIVLILSGRAGENHIHATSIATLSGSLPNASGTYRIPLEALDTGIIVIGASNDTTPPTVVWVSPSGKLEVQGITLQATTDENAQCKYDYSDAAYSSMSFSFEGSLLTHQKNLGLLGEDNYTYYVRCRDTVGNAMLSSAIINFSLIVNESGSDTPVVNLEGPPNESQKNFNLVKFVYNVTSALYDLAYCKLSIHGFPDAGGEYNQIVIDDSVVESSSQSISTTLPKGNHTWYINCTDNSPDLNLGKSAVRAIRINATYDEAFVNSCAGWCGWEGFSTGVCDNNVNKCANNCGLPYSGTSNCYAGADVSEEFCTGGSESDTCCCVV
ncbi:MAG: class III signal peptide-containing protein [Candidatus Woesearchaeota archaeon]